MKLNILISVLLINFITASHGFALTTNKPLNMDTRKFCKLNGGQIQEMGYSYIHMCCYKEKQKCLIVDEIKGYSKLIPLTFRSF